MPTCSSPKEATDAGRHDEALKELEKALAVNPSSLDAHALQAAITYIKDKPQEFEALAAKTLAIAPSYGNVYRVAGELSAHNYRFDEAVELTRRALALDSGDPRTLGDLGVHLLRTGDEPSAADGARGVVQGRSFNKLTYNLLQMMDGLDKFVTLRDGDVVMRPAQGRSVGPRRVRDAARQTGAEHAGGALRVHAARSDPHRDLSQARRLRGPDRSAPRHDPAPSASASAASSPWTRRRRARRASSSGKRRSGTSSRT
jgi:tetratricopeptide (TPR) repeat protein